MKLCESVDAGATATALCAQLYWLSRACGLLYAPTPRRRNSTAQNGASAMACEPAQIGSRRHHQAPRPRTRRPSGLRCPREPRRRNHRTRCLLSQPARLRHRCAGRAPCRRRPPTPLPPMHRGPFSSRGIVRWNRLTSCSIVHRCRGAGPGSGFWTGSCVPPLDGPTGCGCPNQSAGLEAGRIRHSLAGDGTDVSSSTGRRQSRAV
jgi:hypothetical protein